MNQYLKPEDHCLNSHLSFATHSCGVTWLPGLQAYKVWLFGTSEDHGILRGTSVDLTYHLTPVF